ncbi:MAG: hypothetical protein A2X05_11515 [Bacteroidetes bacterium GWE2_41_25]|nr:MAG: hypothetical protein A2X03_00085 [Bacteroidetes bacterium GWA2_40_15]OFX96150.1 MAG: hypothetical protein A2X05_11515 [Bacteroidetes bacterium GWE2_41_25]OFY01562.1 MAG: hypothetical protein A2X06_03705 [Bacteroidetes bacterium GWC2_40_22]OFY60584.1 MAG: hypothetical protein A2X04_08675 [Bacteroidetes bacterium GWF2_41_9]HAM09251.1 hypothetical protein [Bacteroidales bacterium]
MKYFKFSLLLILVILLWMCRESSKKGSFTKNDFIDPPIYYWPRPLYFWNNATVTADVLIEQMQSLRDKCGYGGFGVVPFGRDFSPEYLSEEYLKLYGTMLEKAKDLGMTISLYDEFGFPSGSVGAFAEGDGKPRFRQKYPDQTIQRLDKAEEEITGPVIYRKKVPEGKLMGAVAMDLKSKERIDITGSVTDGMLKWDVPSGKWKIMFFNCVIDGNPLADYLDPEAVGYFTKMVHDVYYDRFKDYFGTVISGTFFDEPSMYRAQFRMWTPMFNEKFTGKHGFSPVTLYPALWYDIGDETWSARNYMFGFRAELYSEGFHRVVSDWSVAHGITATGHTAPEEAIIPANGPGDLMKSFKYLEIPGIDKIGGHRPAEKFYKLVSSSANNWDKKLVMSETFGAMPNYDEPGDLAWNDIWSIANDQYTKGINMLIPHAVWYDNTKVTYKPELSYRSTLYADSLKDFTTYLSRLNVILQSGGRHVADIAVLYPVHSLLGDHYFYTETGPANVDGWVDPENSFFNDAVSKIDYVDIGGWLMNGNGLDFTYIHPEVLDEKCSVAGSRLELKNSTNYENYSVLLLPSCYMLSLSNLRKVVEFYNSGGMVVFTSRLPHKSCETGKDMEVDSLIRSVFPGLEDDAWEMKENEKGGKAFFMPDPDAVGISEILYGSGLYFDVSYPLNPDIQYIHKVVDNRNVYFFANSGKSGIQTEVTLRGKIKVEEWDPHTGEIRKAETRYSENKSSGSNSTVVEINLKPYNSIFLIEKE